MLLKAHILLLASGLAIVPLAYGQAIRSNPGCRGSALERNDDGSSGLVQLGFTVNMFGKQRQAVYVNNNGNITFDSPLDTFTPEPIGSIANEIIAAFWADVDTRATLSNLVTYGRDSIGGRPAFCANYINVGYYRASDDKLNSFQIVLIERSDTGAGNFDIEFNYERVLWETGDWSGGSGGLGGVSARVGYTNGTRLPNTSFELPGSGTPGSFLDSAPGALVRRSLNTSVPGRLLFAVRTGALRQSLTAAPVSLVFRAPGTSPAAPGAQTVEVSSNGGSLPFRISRVTPSSGVAWLTASPLSGGTTPGTITVRVNPQGLTRGAYSGELFVETDNTAIPGITIPVVFLVGDQVPYLTRPGVVNGASYLPGVLAPGSIFSIFGDNLAPAQVVPNSVPLQQDIQGVVVLINGQPVPLFFVSSGQINGQVPLTLPTGSAQLTVRANGTSSAPVIVDVATALPGVFQIPNTSRGIVQNQDFSLNSISNPARNGQFIVVYLTGIGAVDNPVTAGSPTPLSPLSRALARFSATIGGVNAQVLFAGLTPGFIGLAQVNIVVPTSLLPGGQQLVLFANDVQSSPVLIYTTR